MLSWTPEAEIELVEAALKGDTIKQAVSFVFKERTENSGGIDELAGVIEDAFTCGMEETISYTIKALQAIYINDRSYSDSGYILFTFSLCLA